MIVLLYIVNLVSIFAFIENNNGDLKLPLLRNKILECLSKWTARDLIRLDRIRITSKSFNQLIIRLRTNHDPIHNQCQEHNINKGLDPDHTEY